MKDENIALFKRFLKTHGINVMFAGMYKQFHFPESPEDVEDYLRKVDAKDAVINAFKFPQNLQKFGPDYWLDIAVKWEETLKVATNGGYYTTAPKAVEKFGREAAKPLREFTAFLHPNGEKPKPVSVTTPPKPRPAISEEQAVTSGFKFLEFEKNPNRRLVAGKISLNTNSGGFRVTFNNEVSEEIKKSKHRFFRIAQRDGDSKLYFIFSDDSQGLEWRESGGNVTFSNKQLVVAMKDFFGIKGVYEQLNISKNMANSKDYLTYSISKA
ncbi:MAG: hypothetical protein IJR71_01645 [Prevotella sp.]|nr:hypothetical protein [Prevotella sp.]